MPDGKSNIPDLVTALRIASNLATKSAILSEKDDFGHVCEHIYMKEIFPQIITDKRPEIVQKLLNGEYDTYEKLLRDMNIDYRDFL